MTSAPLEGADFVLGRCMSPAGWWPAGSPNAEPYYGVVVAGGVAGAAGASGAAGAGVVGAAGAGVSGAGVAGALDVAGGGGVVVPVLLPEK